MHKTLDFNQFAMLGFPEEKLVKPYFIMIEVDAHNRQYQSSDNYPLGQKTSIGSLIYTLIDTIQCNLATPFLKHKHCTSFQLPLLSNIIKDLLLKTITIIYLQPTTKHLHVVNPEELAERLFCCMSKERQPIVIYSRWLFGMLL